LSIITLACNISSNSQPPTLVPRASETPLPTIAYATLSPAELPPQVAPRVSSEAALVNLFNRVESDRLFLHIDTLMNFRTRHVNSPGGQADQGIGAAYNYIMSQFEQIRGDSGGKLYVFPHEFRLTWAGMETTQRNIVAVLQGTEIGGGTIVIGAHYDSVSLNPEDGLAYAPGADDNASGVAALIELARIMSTQPHKSSIVFVAFSAEEVGRQGSAAFVRDYIQAQNISLNAMISLDIIGSQTGPNGAVDDRARHEPDWLQPHAQHGNHRGGCH
jgi:acetylornithine deacetylase/succinyl-diaminopimelate desuccinylase-like protein